MGEYVWTTVEIGGPITKQNLAKLDELAFVDPVLVGKEPVLFEGEVNYGNPEEVRDFCREHGLTYRITWACQPGQFDAGIQYWAPGMEKEREIGCDDNGDPVLSLKELKALQKAGATLAAVISAMELLALPIPPLTLLKPAPRLKLAPRGRQRKPRREEEAFDPENIYNSPTMRQSIEEDRK